MLHIVGNATSSGQYVNRSIGVSRIFDRERTWARGAMRWWHAGKRYIPGDGREALRGAGSQHRGATT